MPVWHKKHASIEEARMFRQVERILRDVPEEHCRVPKQKRYSNGILYTERITGDTLADMYGDDLCMVPEHYLDVIRNTIRLLAEHGV